jgi:hypothetical protein
MSVRKPNLETGAATKGAWRPEREALFLGATIEVSGRSASGRIRNISPTGALLETSETLILGDEIIVSFRGVTRTAATIKRRTQKGFGIKFLTPIDPSGCRLSVAAVKRDMSDEYLLNLREGYRRPLWDNHDARFSRPKIK